MMMSDFSPGANEATGFISLLAIAQALGRLSKATKDKLKKDILFILFDAVGNRSFCMLLHVDKFENFLDYASFIKNDF